MLRLILFLFNINLKTRTCFSSVFAGLFRCVLILNRVLEFRFLFHKAYVACC